MLHILFTIRDLTDKEEIIEVLKNLETDEDFNGHNGLEYCWVDTIDKGFNSNQEYVIDCLRNSSLKGEELVIKFFRMWFDNDAYYTNWNIKSDFADNNKCIFSIVAD